MDHQQPNHLAWHETLEIHELVAFQAIGLMKCKKTYSDITDPALKDLYKEAIEGLSANIRELIMFYPVTARSEDEDDSRNDETPFYAGDLLVFMKTSVRNYAIAITETATPALRDVLKLQLMAVINLHAKVFYYMYGKSYYPSYDLDKLLQNDINLASKALNQSL
ncbi:spore coat protein [Halalkalibacter urbisdiaboli]|uniref:spore coat protein n=1 Tax=Halalkalibacter urbisdiaboli TaxID=1960589 RepID=UPI000B43A5F9|nr:spore coat protein [Halalkalibacter urbisdiaboli]